MWRYLLALVLVSGLAGAGLAGGSWYLDHKLATAKEVEVDLDEDLPGAINFLILGSDSRAFVNDEADETSFGDASEVGGQRADVIIVVHVEPKSQRALLVSFPRDLYVTHPGRRGQHRINVAFGRGPQGVIDVLRSNFHIPIHHYLELDFAAFRDLVEALGGVRMFVASPVRDHKSGLDIPTPGCVTLAGPQALAWVRSRHFTYLEAGRWRTDPSGDIGRIGRQQEFIRRLVAEAIRRGALNPLRANRLAGAALANLTVDSEFSARDALRLVEAFRPGVPYRVEMLALPTRPAGAGLVTTAETEAVVARLRGAGDDPALAGVVPGDVRVRVLNGTGAAGLASQTSAALATAGFAPAGAADAARFTYATTEIRYASPALVKAQLLARYLKGAGKLVKDSNLGDLDVVLVVGRDFNGVAEPPVLPTAAHARAVTTTTGPAPNAATVPSTPSSADAPADC